MVRKTQEQLIGRCKHSLSVAPHKRKRDERTPTDNNMPHAKTHNNEQVVRKTQQHTAYNYI